MGLTFNIADVQKQVRGIAQIGHSYLDRGSSDLLDRAADELPYVVKDGGSWAIDRENPVRTTVSNGGYERDERRGFEVSGRLSFKWSVEPVGRREFKISGNASTLIWIVEPEREAEEGNESCLFCWNVDVASAGGPVGPKFHTQVHNPRELPIPRFPAISISPADCLDFLLGELFIEAWPRHQSRHRETPRFCSDQIKRLRAVLSGLSQSLDASDESLAGYSALLRLKHWQPQSDLFLGL